ncbi:MAG TPA: hypothetical protein VNT81_06010 [Vicinamibacterales bacterium]|nr:hypothetical protein [Vicinamibacterales bacterium]
MSTEHDLEYGPTPPGAKYEHTDIDPSIGYKFGLWLFVAMFISFGIVYGAFWFFERQEQAANAAAQKYPLSAGQRREPPAPNLQTQPFKDVYMLRQAEAAKLGAYGWVDKEGGVAHIPIDRAIDVMLERGFPARAEGGNALNVVTQDSSSGRTTVPR